MQRSVTLALCAILLGFVVLQPCRAQQPIPPYEKLVGTNAVFGKEYWIAIPPNEVPGYSVIALEIYVASVFDTEVEVLEAETGKSYKKTLKKGEILTLTDSRGETNWAWEIRNAEVVEPKGIRLTSAKPISVYVLNSKVFTSDGYMAIPTKLWDTNYIAVSYYDFKEARDWAGGFVVIAQDNNTQVTIDLKGTGGAYATTSGGKAINTGKPFTVTLDEGQTYMVHGDGLTRAIFDLTGTSITSSKAIGVIGFHQRTTMPNLLMNGNGRNHLVEMIPPVSAWGTKYVTVELSRNHFGPGRGDMFRVVASQPQTLVTLEYFDKNTKKKLGGSGFVLNKAGDFLDFSQSSNPTALPEGVSIWSSDKPVFVGQYSCSSSWDGDITLDPFMLNLTPLEQFTRRTIFQLPSATSFTTHKLNLIVQANTSSPTLIDDLKSLLIDDRPIWNDSRAISPTLLFNRITGTDLYWTTIDFQSDAKSHTITCNDSIRFGGYIYGYGQTDAYGWPLAAMSKDLTDTSTTDTLKPIIAKSGSAGSMTFTASEVSIQEDPTAPAPFAFTQVPTGIADAGLLEPQPGFTSSNYAFTFTSDSSLPRVNPSKLLSFTLSVKDQYQSAVAYFYVMDWAGNITYDSLRYVFVPKSQDTMRPQLRKTGVSRLLTVTATEMRNIPNPPTIPTRNGDQVESGLADIGLVSNDPRMNSVNYTLVFQTDSTLQRTPLYKSFTFNLAVQDTTMAAAAYFYAVDSVGNKVIDSVKYKPVITTEVSEEQQPGTTPFSLSAFPQPASTACTVHWTGESSTEAVALKLTDLQGRVLWQGSTAAGQHDFALPVSDLPSGTFVVQCMVGSEVATTTIHIKR